jgi:hypothetical protein
MPHAASHSQHQSLRIEILPSRWLAGEFPAGTITVTVLAMVMVMIMVMVMVIIVIVIMVMVMVYGYDHGDGDGHAYGDGDGEGHGSSLMNCWCRWRTRATSHRDPDSEGIIGEPRIGIGGIADTKVSRSADQTWGGQ